MSGVDLVLVLTENWTMTPAEDPMALVDLAVAAEEAGWGTAMVSEHVVLGAGADRNGLPANPRDWAYPGNQDPDMAWPDPFVLLSAVASRTTTMRLAASAVITPLRHPLHLATQIATLDRLSRGRLVVQPTVSWHEAEYAALDVDFHRRGRILDEQLEVLAAVWRDQPASHHGRPLRLRRRPRAAPALAVRRAPVVVRGPVAASSHAATPGGPRARVESVGGTVGRRLGGAARGVRGRRA